jgi:hypothetical protein
LAKNQIDGNQQTQQFSADGTHTHFNFVGNRLAVPAPISDCLTHLANALIINKVIFFSSSTIYSYDDFRRH